MFRVGTNEFHFQYGFHTMKEFQGCLRSCGGGAHLYAQKPNVTCEYFTMVLYRINDKISDYNLKKITFLDTFHYCGTIVW